MPEASPVWQTAFLVWSLVCVGWFTFSGWQAGIARGILSIGGMVIGYFVGSGIALATPGFAVNWIPGGGGLGRIVLGLCAGIGVYLAIRLFAALLFKRTAQQRTVTMRLVWGLGGAACGLLIGAVIALSILSGARTLGGFAQARMETELALGTTGATSASAFEQSLVKLKLSIDAGDAGRTLKALDLTPPAMSRISVKLGRLVADPAATMRFLQSPELEPILMDRSFVNLIADPEVSNAGARGDHAGVMTSPRLLDALRDPAFLEKLTRVNWEGALDSALLGSPETPTQ